MHGAKFIRTWTIVLRIRKSDFILAEITIHHIKFMKLLRRYFVAGVLVFYLHICFGLIIMRGLNIRSSDLFHAATYLNCIIMKVI